MSFYLSLQEFKKILPNTFIYDSILIKIYMNANIKNTQIFCFISVILKVTKAPFYDLTFLWTIFCLCFYNNFCFVKLCHVQYESVLQFNFHYADTTTKGSINLHLFVSKDGLIEH